MWDIAKSSWSWMRDGIIYLYFRWAWVSCNLLTDPPPCLSSRYGMTTSFFCLYHIILHAEVLIEKGCDQVKPWRLLRRCCRNVCPGFWPDLLQVWMATVNHLHQQMFQHPMESLKIKNKIRHFPKLPKLQSYHRESLLSWWEWTLNCHNPRVRKSIRGGRKSTSCS